jgi:hypothetical protein
MLERASFKELTDGVEARIVRAHHPQAAVVGDVITEPLH